MYSLYWIQEALVGIPSVLWMYLGLGIPAALLILPTRHWQSRTMIAAVAMAMGPALMTAWMFILGTIGASLNQPLLQFNLIFLGSLLIAAVCAGLAWRKGKSRPAKNASPSPLALDEKLIIGMIIIAVILRVIITAFWTFTSYDALWVYGFEGRLYFLEQLIPHHIDYYPQFVPLQYTYVQLAIGAINDHAARMVIPMMHIGSILAAYLLGEGLFNRRIGLITAALWSLHPFVAQWSFIGDLEIPVTFSFTLTALFFLMAWIEDSRSLRRHYAIIAGIMLGIAMWTKPTAGALIWGVLILALVDLTRLRFQWRAWLPRFEAAFWTGLACIPLGAIWYLRNIALGHDVLVLPHEVWLTFARRSGDHFNWIILALILSFSSLALQRGMTGRSLLAGAIGILLILVGVLPSNPLITPERFDPPLSYISSLESIFIILGFIIFVLSVYPQIHNRIREDAAKSVRIVGWALLLGLPYFITWFYSYSYHYRLGFAIVPLMILPSAVILGNWLTIERISGWQPILKVPYYLGIIAIALPGMISVLFDNQWSSGWLWNPKLTDDVSKYQAFNSEIIEVVYKLYDYINKHEDDPIVIAPGEQRLHFFFPQMQIIDAAPTRLDELDSLNATHFLYGTQARWRYERDQINPLETQIVASFGRFNIFNRLVKNTDSTFSVELYEFLPKQQRFTEPGKADFPIIYDEDIIFGDRLRFVAQGIYPLQIIADQKIGMRYAWQALQAIYEDYQFVLQLYNYDTSEVEWEWTLPTAPHDYGDYATHYWDVNEYVWDNKEIFMSNPDGVPDGDNYEVRLRVFSPSQYQYLPIHIDGKLTGDYYPLVDKFKVRT